MGHRLELHSAVEKGTLGSNYIRAGLSTSRPIGRDRLLEVLDQIRSDCEKTVVYTGQCF